MPSPPPPRQTRRILWLEAELWRSCVKSGDTVMTVFVIDPAIRLVLPLFLRAGIAPNTVTTLSFFASLLDAWLFLQGEMVWGGIVFVLWYWLDCIDGKIARATGRCTKFGWWYDVFTDRLGTATAFCALGYRHLDTGDRTAGLLAFGVLVVWLLGCLNTNTLKDAKAAFDAPATEVGGTAATTGSPTPAAPRSGLRAAMDRMRLGRFPVHDTEYLTLAATVGPVTGHYAACYLAAIAAISLHRGVQTAGFWWRRRARIGVV